MSNKLTLSIDAQVVAKAKKYAAWEGRSLSSLIEAYLMALTNEEPQERRAVDPLVDALWGAFNVEEKNMDYEKILEDELIKKYMK